VDSGGNAYVVGDTRSPSFPTTPGALDTSPNTNENTDVFITKLNAGGSALVYSTFLGGNLGANSSGIAVDTFGSAYVTQPLVAMRKRMRAERRRDSNNIRTMVQCKV